MGHGGHAAFGQKLLNAQHSVGRCTHKSPIMKWANTLRVFRKNPPKPNVASHNTTSWCTDTDGFLEHSLSGGSLDCKGPALWKIILGLFGFFWSSLIILLDLISRSWEKSFMLLLFFHYQGGSFLQEVKGNTSLQTVPKQGPRLSCSPLS